MSFDFKGENNTNSDGEMGRTRKMNRRVYVKHTVRRTSYHEGAEREKMYISAVSLTSVLGGLDR